MKVAVVERKLFGGTCVNTGCIPTQTMVASAYAAHTARRASDFGVVIDGGVSVDMRLVKARKEFGQMFRRFRSDTAIVEMGPRLVQREDEDVSVAIQEILEGEDIRLRLNAKCIGFSKRGKEIIAHGGCAEGPSEISGTHLLLAIGRRPNTDDLGLGRRSIAYQRPWNPGHG
jgi:pyruvate/2-oxoglutarate dehydrogenase complex dihydrolipoamide dehydrogenase (E3) component